MLFEMSFWKELSGCNSTELVGETCNPENALECVESFQATVENKIVDAFQLWSSLSTLNDRTIFLFMKEMVSRNLFLKK